MNDDFPVHGVTTIDDAIEFCGRSLLLRIKSHGIISEKTAESHFQLGILYYQKEKFTEALKEIHLGRSIYCKLSNNNKDESILVSDCDMAIGQVEFRLNNTSRAYAFFYECYNIRYLLLEGSHQLTLACKAAVEDLRQKVLQTEGERIVCSLELKDRVLELSFNKEPLQSVKYSVYLHVNRLQNDLVMNPFQVRQLVISAVHFYESRFKITDDSFDEDLAEVSNIVELLLQEAIPQKGSRAINSSISRENSSNNIYFQSPKREFSLSPMNTTQQSLTSPKLPSLRSLHIGTDTNNQQEDHPNQDFRQPQTINTITSISTDSNREQQEHSPRGRLHSNEQLPLSQTDNHGQKDTSEITVSQRTWRRIPKGSPLRSNHGRYRRTNRMSSDSTAAGEGSSSGHDIELEESAAGLAAQIEQSRRSYFLLRALDSGAGEKLDKLYVLRKAGSRQLASSFQTKILTFALIAHIAREKKAKKINTSQLPTQRSTLSGGRSGSMVSGALVGGLFTPAELSQHDATINVVDISNTDKLPGNKVPVPPPLPTSWPPVIFKSGVDTPNAATVNAIGSSRANGPAPKLKLIQLVHLSCTESTFWKEQLSNSDIFSASQVFNDIDEHFSLANKKQPANKLLGKSKPGVPNKGKAHGKQEGALDAQRAQNINIMLAKFGRKPIESIANAVRDFDVEGLGLTAISALLQYIPTSDECKRVNKFVSQLQKKQLQSDEKNEKEPQSTKEEFVKDNKAESKDQKEQVHVGVDMSSDNPPKQAKAAPAFAAALTAMFATRGSSQGSEGSSEKKAETVESSPREAENKTTNKPNIEDGIDSGVLNAMNVGRAEQYIYFFSKIPQLEKRLSAMISVLSAKEIAHNIDKNSQLLITVIEEVRGSGRLKFLLKTALELSNILQEKAFEGITDNSVQPIEGFKIGSWTKLSQTKCNNGDTVEQYLVNKLLTCVPEALDLLHDMPSLEEAKTVSINRLFGDITKLRDGLDVLEQLRESSADSLIRHCLEYERIFHKCKETVDSMVNEYKALCIYYGEEYPPVEPEVFFGDIYTICTSMQALTHAQKQKARRKAVNH